MDFIPNEIVSALQIADKLDNIADNGIAYKQLTLSGDVLLQCCNQTVIVLEELHSVVLPYLKIHNPEIYSIVKENRDSLLRDMREGKEIAQQGNKMQWPDKVQNKIRNLAKALRASSGQSIDSQNKQEDIVDLKPNFCGIGLNINALIRKTSVGLKIKNLLKAFIYKFIFF